LKNFILLIFLAILLAGCNSADNKTNQNNAEITTENDGKPIKPEKITEETVTFKLNEIHYDREKNSLSINIHTGLPDHSKVIMTLRNNHALDKQYEKFSESLFVPNIELEVKDNKIIYTFTDDDFNHTKVVNIGYYIEIDIPVNAEKNAFFLEDFSTDVVFEQAFPIYKGAVLDYSIDDEGEEVEGYNILGKIDMIENIPNTFSFEEILAPYKNSSISYKELEKNSNSFLDKPAVFQGEILQIEEDNIEVPYVYDNEKKIAKKHTTIRLQVSSDPNEVVFVEYVNDTGIDNVRGDTITVYGDISGEVAYESVAGYQITIPSMDAKAIE
jgi:hypothetical protein